MYKLALIFALITCVCAKLNRAPDFWFLEYFNEVEEPNLKRAPKVLEHSKDVWVFNLDLDSGLGSFRLTLANKEEEKDFDDLMEPMIENFKNRHGLQKSTQDAPSKRVKKQLKSYNTDKSLKMKEEIRKIINKFVLTYVETGSHLPGADEEHSSNPSLALYFKGPFTSLLVKFGRKRWHYFIGPPSPFSYWFSKEHTDVSHDGEAMYVQIPAVLKEEFYSALLNLLRNLFSFPV